MPVLGKNERREKIGEKKQHPSYTTPLVPRSVSGVCSVGVWWYWYHYPAECNRIIDTDGGDPLCITGEYSYSAAIGIEYGGLEATCPINDAAYAG